MFLDEFLKEKYKSTFDRVYNNLLSQKNNDENFTKENLKALLNDLYIYQGNDWLGRGEIMDVVNSATIAASEQLLAEWD